MTETRIMTASPHAYTARGLTAFQGANVADQTPVAYQCPLCQRPAYGDYWAMVGCAGRDLAAAEDPQSPTGRILAGRPVPRDDTPARRPTTADLTVYAVAALLKIHDTLGQLQQIAQLVQAAVDESTQDRDAMRARLTVLEAAVAVPAPDPGGDPEPPTD